MSDAPRPEDATAAEDATVPATSDASSEVHPTTTTTETSDPSALSDEAAAEPDEAASEPTAEELASAVPAVVRRAPRFARVMLTGAGTPAAVGFLIGALLPNSVATGRVVTGLLIALGFAIIGGTLTGLYVARADDVASKRADAERKRLLAAQADAPSPFMPVGADTSADTSGGSSTTDDPGASTSGDDSGDSTATEEGEAR